MSGTDPNVVGIKVGTQTLSGWQEVRITRGIETCPPSFDLGLTELPPQAFTPEPVPLQPYDFQLGQELPGGSTNIGAVPR